MSPLRSLLLLTVLTQAVQPSAGRGLLTESQGPVIVTSETDIHEVLSRIEDGQTVIFEAEEIVLNRTLVVEKANITLRGLDSGNTILRCHPSAPRGALLIRQGGGYIKDLSFVDCHGAPAVLIEPTQGTPNVHFERVHFRNNGRKGEGVCGAAVSLGFNDTTLHNDTCFVRFTSCRFSQNRAAFGGAIFVSDAHINITDSTFDDNEADVSGGAIYIQGIREASLTMDASSFSKNCARGKSDRLNSMDGKLASRVEDKTSIAAGTGGAVFVNCSVDISITASNFSHNVGHKGGGGLAVAHTRPQTSDQEQTYIITHSLFDSNFAHSPEEEDVNNTNVQGLATYLGGAIYYHHSGHHQPGSWNINETVFVRNRAAGGGAICLESLTRSTSSNMIISDSRFENNSVHHIGGAIFTSALNIDVLSTIFRKNEAIYGGSLFLYQSPATKFRHNPEDPKRVSVIEDSMAYYGGGMFIHAPESGVDLSALIVTKNTAVFSGGGILVENLNRDVVFRGIIVEKNMALLGGGIALIAVANFTIDSDNQTRTIIQENHAAVGGGLHFEPGETSPFLNVTIAGAVFRRNRAWSMEDIRSKLQSKNTKIAPSDTSDADLRQLTDTSAGNGGGICASVHNIRPLAAAEIKFHDLRIEENIALVGGGLFFRMGDLEWNAGGGYTNASCFPANFGLDHCRRFLFFNVSVTKNEAKHAAGWFSSSPHALASICNVTEDEQAMIGACRENTIEAVHLHHCESITDNRLRDGTGGLSADFGTRAMCLAIEGRNGPLKKVKSDEILVIPCENDSNSSCPLRIAVKDIFNHTIKHGIDDANLTLLLESDDIVGERRYTAVNGIAEIGYTKAKGFGVTSILTVRSERDPEMQISIPFSTRECYPGEVQGTTCDSCDVNQYSFHPDKCQSCEDNALCRGGAIQVPSQGYWHSTPFSPVFRACVHKEACNYEGREDRLMDFLNCTSDDDKSVNLQRTIRQFKASCATGDPPPDFSKVTDLQCRKGYRGFLCGSCEPGYGRSVTRSCRPCPERREGNSIYLCLVVGWLFLLIGFNCGITLASINSRVDLVQYDQEIHLADQYRLPLSRQNARRHLEQPTEVLSSGRPSVSDFRGDPHRQSVFAQQLIATVQLTETLKILMNYLQVTGTALRLQTDWNPLLKGLLTFENGIVGLPIDFLSMPYECIFKNTTTPVSILASWIRLAIPWAVLVSLEAACILVALFLTLLAAYRYRTFYFGFRSRERFLTYMIVISIVSMYFSYIDVVRELLRTLNCIKIQNSTRYIDEDHPYINYATETVDVHVWVEDTDLVCLRGSHLPIGIVGMIGLFISAGGIVSNAIWLPLNAEKKTQPEFVARYWFLYQAYRPKWYTAAWESTILCRKSLLAGVIVFSSHLGPSLQAAMCAGILTAALFLHAVLSPFKIPQNHQNVPPYAGKFFEIIHQRLAAGWIKFNNSMHLNTVESVSLISSITMFYCAIVLQDSTSSLTGRTMMISFAFLVNVTVPCYMVYRLYAGLHFLLDLKLELMGAGIPGSQNRMTIPKLIRKTLCVIRTRRAKRESSQAIYESSSYADTSIAVHMSGCLPSD